MDQGHNAFLSYREYVRKEDATLPIWGGEIGPAYHGGQADVTNRFLDGFWYLDHLGFLAKSGVQVFLRSTLCGGDYELLNRTTGLPNPDYFVAYLWKRTTGTAALNVISSSSFPKVRAYSMCGPANNGSFTVILMNMDTNPQTIEIKASSLIGYRHSYYVRSTDGLNSQLAELRLANGNWMPLQLSPKGDLPDILPVVESVSSSIQLEPLSYVFFSFPDSVLSSCKF